MQTHSNCSDHIRHDADTLSDIIHIFKNNLIYLYLQPIHQYALPNNQTQHRNLSINLRAIKHKKGCQAFFFIKFVFIKKSIIFVMQVWIKTDPEVGYSFN